jgi:hypothetical protein
VALGGSGIWVDLNGSGWIWVDLLVSGSEWICEKQLENMKKVKLTLIIAVRCVKLSKIIVKM